MLIHGKLGTSFRSNFYVFVFQAEEKRLKELEERLKREEVEAELYEKMRIDDERQRRGFPVTSMLVDDIRQDEEVIVVKEIKCKNPAHLGVERVKIEDGDHDLFNLTRDGGTRDVVGQRVLQVTYVP